MDLHAYHQALNLGFSESEASRIGDDAWENNRQQPTCAPEPEPDYYDVLVAENTRLLATISRLRAELASWQKAFGLLTTLHGSMQIDISDPLRMAKSIEGHVRAELEEYRRGAERYRTALEQIVAPFEDLNFVSGNKLLTYIHDTATAALAAKEE